MPIKSTFHRAINQRLKEAAFRRLAVEAVDVLQASPTLFGSFDDGESFSIPFMDVYCQTARPQYLAFEDLVMAAFGWQSIQQGELIYRYIDAGKEPYADADIEGNRSLLAALVDADKTRDLYGLIEADFWGGNDGEDGFMSFSRPPIRAFEGYGTDRMGIPEEPPSDPRDGLCTRFPLEVGACMPDQMEWHLSQTKCVARYPYRSRLIVLLESTKPSEWAPRPG